MAEGSEDDRSPPVEPARERINRNFAELLQEVRVAQTGVQFLFAFLLTLPFTNRFEDLGDRDIAAYAISVVAAAVAAVTLVAPVSYHRIAFRAGRKPELVAAASLLAQCGLVAFGFSLIAAGFLIADVVLGMSWAIGFSILLFLLAAILWFVLPLAHPLLRRQQSRWNQ
jgi:hypothetical protein